MSEYIIRDHDAGSFEARRSTLRHIEKNLNEIWGEGTVKLTLKDEYQNMEGIIKEHMYLIEHARKACEAANVPEDISPIRGGTDGCKLSFRGLPCPNLGTGGHGYHGPMEHATVEGMEVVPDSSYGVVHRADFCGDPYGNRSGRTIFQADL